MATVSNTLKLSDKMTPALKSIITAMNSTLRAMESMDAASSSAFRSAKRDAAMASAAVDDFASSFDDVSQGAKRAERGAGSSLDNLVSKVAMVTAAVYGIRKALELAGKVSDISDQMTQATSRLGLLSEQMPALTMGIDTTSAEGQAAKLTALQDQVLASAQRSRSGYLETIDAVSQLGMNAGDAFSSTDEIVAFSELMNKSFKVSGADAQAQAGAMRQLTQALASGVLRGDEFNSIAEQAPMVYQAIADYMGKSKGEIRALAAEGALTADVVKNAMFAASDSIEGKFSSMPKTWADNWTTMKNNALVAFQPVLSKVNELANSERFQRFIESTQAGFATLANIALGALDMISAGVGWAADHADLLLLVIGALGIAFMVMGVKAGAAWAMAHWPILAVIAAIGVAVAVLSHFGITGEQALGAVGGAIFWVGALFKNLGLSVANIGLGIANVFMAVVDNVITAFTNAGLNIKSFFFNLMSTILSFVASIAEALNKLPFVEFDYSGLSGKASEYAQTAAEAQAAKGEYKSIGDAWNEGMSTFDTFAEGWGSDAFAGGQAWAKNLTGALGDFTSGIENFGTQMDYSQFGGVGGMSIDEIGKVGSVGRIDDEVSIKDEDIKLLKDVAALEFQMNFTQLTPQFHAGDFIITKEADADQILSYIEESVSESLRSSLLVL